MLRCGCSISPPEDPVGLARAIVLAHGAVLAASGVHITLPRSNTQCLVALEREALRARCWEEAGCRQERIEFGSGPRFIGERGAHAEMPPSL